MRLKIFFVSLLLALIAPAALAQDDEFASVSGRVTTYWGSALEAEISFFQLEGISGNSPTEELIQRVTTNKDGAYAIEKLPWGQYRVKVATKGYGDAEIWRFYLWRGAKRVLDIGVPMGMLDHISQMEIRGAVTRPNRMPVKDATVTLLNVYDSSESQQVRTDADGKYTLLLIQEGDYVLHAAKVGFTVSATTISIRSGERKTSNLVLSPVVKK
ncbi:MAG TPA: carboxypeptidase-like regulatory domain-containing protein [Pyrinomonadaceae bacterium]|nr:carboxypeptidase-like regulatory domain-containing protein [Pyrinomonadaceae bacterium]